MNRLKTAKMPKGTETRRKWYSRLTRDQLRLQAKILNIPGRGKMVKEDLLEACIQADTGWVNRHKGMRRPRRA